MPCDNDIDKNPRINYTDMTINTRVLGKYFSEGYREYLTNPANPKLKDESLFNFIRERIKKMNSKIEKRLLNTKFFEEFKKIALSNNIVNFKDLNTKTLKHMASLMPKNNETIENHSDPREAFIKK